MLRDNNFLSFYFGIVEKRVPNLSTLVGFLLLRVNIRVPAFRHSNEMDVRLMGVCTLLNMCCFMCTVCYMFRDISGSLSSLASPEVSNIPGLVIDSGTKMSDIVLAHQENYIWIGNHWIPPSGVLSYSANQSRAIWGSRNALFVGDSVCRQDWATMHAILTADDVTTGALNRHINLNKVRSPLEHCSLRNFSNTSFYSAHGIGPAGI